MRNFLLLMDITDTAIAFHLFCSEKWEIIFPLLADVLRDTAIAFPLFCLHLPDELKHLVNRDRIKGKRWLYL